MTELLQPDSRSAGDTTCFHCGAPVPPTVALHALIGGVERPMCCAGCRAVAAAIAGAGFADYYTRRANPARQGASAQRGADTDLAAFDTEIYQRAVVQRGPGDTREVSLLLGGVTCAACNWLIEQRLQSLPGVIAAAVNFSTQRARVRWDAARVRLSEILAAVRSIGYDAEPYDAERAQTKRRADDRAAVWRLFVAAFGMMQVMMYAVPTYLADGDMSLDIEALMRWASLLLTLPVVGFSSQPFFSGALRDLRARRVGMDVPVALGILIAFAASVHATVIGRGDVYFDSITMFVFLLLGARYLEQAARARCGEALERVVHLVPAFANRIAGPHDRIERVAVAALCRGDRVVIAAGETVPADGIVEAGRSAVDEALLTGESAGVGKAPGDTLIAGSINRASRLAMRVERIGAETVVAAIGRLLERAALDKPHMVALADAIAARFIAAILLVAACAALAWWFIDPARALPIAVTVLVITCPCALSLATPAALAAATAALTRRGVLITRGHALETLARATHFVFDKTGTLTTGELRLVGTLPLGRLDARASLALAARLEARSRHPAAVALLDAARREGFIEDADITASDVAGEGVDALIDGRHTRIGRPAFVAQITGRPAPHELAFIADHVQVVALGDESGWIALFTLADQVRPEARALINDLATLGCAVTLLSGDRRPVCEQLARDLGIEAVQAEVRPEAKLAHVRALQRAGAVVAMVGDGVNDAPVLAQAQVSIAMGTGADLAQASADLILTRDGLSRLATSVHVARRTRRIIVQNLIWAGIYNVIAVPAAVLGWVNPLAASVGMALSSAVVVVNALRAARAVPVVPGGRSAPVSGNAATVARPRVQSA